MAIEPAATSADSLLLPWVAWEQNLDQIRTGQGTLTWASDRQRDGVHSVVRTAFSFDGQKRRWDRVFDTYQENGKPVPMQSRVDVENGQRTLDYRLGAKQIYARETGRRDQGRWSGEMVDYKFLMSPILSMSEIQDNPTTVAVKSNNDGTFDPGQVAVDLLSVREAGRRFATVCFDPKLHYAPVRELRYDTKDGRVVQRTTRQFTTDAKGLVSLKSLEQLTYGDASGASAGTPPKVVAKSLVQVASFNPNVAIAPEHFQPRGLGAPVGSRVTDRVLGDLTYELDPTPAELARNVNAAVDEVLKAKKSGDVKAVPVADGNLVPIRSTSRNPSAANAAPSGALRHGGLSTALAVILALAALVAGILLWLRRSRQVRASH